MSLFFILAGPVLVLTLISVLANRYGSKEVAAMAAFASAFGSIGSFLAWLKSGAYLTATASEIIVHQAFWLVLAFVFSYFIVRSQETDKSTQAAPILLGLGVVGAIAHLILFKVGF